MSKRLPIHTGVPMRLAVNPNHPSFDPAVHADDTTRKILWLCENAWEQMTQWERDFCLSVYGRAPLTRSQHSRISKIHKTYSAQ